jgi:SAM-dependent methyltransferase
MMGRADKNVNLAAYESFAAIYNEFNHLNDYEMWLGRVLLPELEKHGLVRGSALDVGCGTGRAFKPLLRRGWQVTGCDLSPSMLEIARLEDEGGEVRLLQTDMRELPILGSFELVLSLNDTVIYLLEDGDIELALAAMRSNLAPNGLLLFDCISRMTFEGFLSEKVREAAFEGRRWRWRSAGRVEGRPSVFESWIEGDDIEPIRLRDRYRPEAEVRDAMARSGLRCLAALGMDEVDGEVGLIEPPDEDRHYKVVYIGARAE